MQYFLRKEKEPDVWNMFKYKQKTLAMILISQLKRVPHPLTILIDKVLIC